MPSYPRRDGAQPCQYYLKTGKCNYGQRCKFDHPQRDKRLLTALLRRDCFDYVQSANCPYGQRCKYNHPPLDTLPHGLTDGLRRHDAKPQTTEHPLPLPLSPPDHRRSLMHDLRLQPSQRTAKPHQSPIPNRKFLLPSLLDDPIGRLRDGTHAVEWRSPLDGNASRPRAQSSRGFDPLAYDAQLFGARPSWAPASSLSR